MSIDPKDLSPELRAELGIDEDGYERETVTLDKPAKFISFETVIDSGVAIDVEEFKELSSPEFLRDVAEKLRHVAPNASGMDDYHIDRLREIARMMDDTTALIIHDPDGKVSPDLVAELQKSGKNLIHSWEPEVPADAVGASLGRPPPGSEFGSSLSWLRATKPAMGTRIYLDIDVTPEWWISAAADRQSRAVGCLLSIVDHEVHEVRAGRGSIWCKVSVPEDSINVQQLSMDLRAVVEFAL